MPHKNKKGVKTRIWRSCEDRLFYFHLFTGNGKIIADSEGYKRRASRDSTVALLGFPIVEAK